MPLIPATPAGNWPQSSTQSAWFVNFNTHTLESFLQIAVEYDESSPSCLRWKVRSPDMFRNPKTCVRWNNQFAGNPAFGRGDVVDRMQGSITLPDGKCHVLRAHRVVWFIKTGNWPLNTIDHINGNNKDNKINNLRDVESKINVKNRAMHSNNKTGHVGVFKRKENEYIITLGIDGKHYRGFKTTLDDAIELRKKFMETYGKNAGFTDRHGKKVDSQCL